ncbi:MAG: hypothetical protein IPK25_19325 [Saprospiraceae bacterium]|nr:hypothetical protein [Saprospiraceae bacterium]
MSSNIHNWKEIHLLFPVNYLGGKNKEYGTSSMIGVKDGLNTVVTLLERGYKNDPLLHYYNLAKSTSINHFPSNLYSHLIESSGKETQAKFPNVQKKELMTFKYLFSSNLNTYEIARI